MYHVILRIHTAGLDADFCEALRTVPAKKNFEHIFPDSVHAAHPPLHVQYRNILLVGEEQLERMEPIPHSRKILVTRTALTVPQRHLAVLDDVWLAPDTAMLRFHFTRLLDRLKKESDLRLSQIYLDTLLDITPSLVWFKDREGLHRRVSKSFCKTVRKTREDVEGKGHAYIWGMSAEEYERSPLACKQSDARALETGNLDVSDELVLSERGVRKFSTWKKALKDDAGAIIGTVGVAYDETDFSNISTELEMLLANLPFAVLITDAANHIVNVNDKFRSMFPEAVGIINGVTKYHAASDRRADIASVLKHELRDMHVPEGGARVPKPYGRERKVFLDIQQKDILDALQARIGSIVIFSDITKEHMSKVTLEKDVYEDALTGLFNRRYFYERIVPAHGAGGLIYLDLDHFKQLNDRCGHHMGDECLKLVGSTLKNIHGQAVRLGGDEFALYFESESLSLLENHALRISQEVSRNLQANFSGITPSLGVASSDASGKTLDDLVRQADAAMYANKRRRAELARLEARLRAEEAVSEVDSEAMQNLRHRIEILRPKVAPYTLYSPGMENSVDKGRKDLDDFAR